MARHSPKSSDAAKAPGSRNEHPGRAGRKPVVAHVPEAAHKSLKRLALDYDTTVEKLIITALDRLLMDMGQDWTIGTGEEFVLPDDTSEPKRR